MKDIHSSIDIVFQELIRWCNVERIPIYYHGHSHFSRGIDLTFEITKITPRFFNNLVFNYANFNIHSDNGHVTLVIRVFDYDDMPF